MRDRSGAGTTRPFAPAARTSMCLVNMMRSNLWTPCGQSCCRTHSRVRFLTIHGQPRRSPCCAPRAGVDVTPQGEFSILAKFPSTDGARNHREGLLVADPVFKAFIETLNAPQTKVCCFVQHIVRVDHAVRHRLPPLWLPLPSQTLMPKLRLRLSCLTSAHAQRTR